MERSARIVRSEASAVPAQHGIQKQKRAMDRVRINLLGTSLWWRCFEALSSARSCFHSPDDAPLACRVLFFSKNERWNNIACVRCVRFRHVFAAVLRQLGHVHGQRATTRSRRTTTDCTSPFLGAFTLREIYAGPCVPIAQKSGELFYHVLDSCWSSRWPAIHLPYGVNSEYE